MIKSRLCDLVGCKYPVFQAGMGPFATTELCIAAANAGCVGLMSTAALKSKESWPQVYEQFVAAAHAEKSDDDVTVFKKMFRRVFEETTEGSIFGVNIMVSEEMKENAANVVQAMREVRAENPEMAKRFRVMLTSAGDPMPWKGVAEEEGMVWAHVMPSVKAARRCKKAGVNVIIASGHESGFHTAWEPVHSMTLLPAVIDEVLDENTLVLGTGGYCDGRTIAAALTMGADGVQMGTRFLCTQESDFAPLWKQAVVNCEDRGTLVARGFVGPARWLKNKNSIEHQKNTLKFSPGVFLGVPDDLSTVPSSLLDYEYAAVNAVFFGDEEKAMMAAGECAQRINDCPTVKEMVEKVMADTEEVLKKASTHVG